MNSNNINDKKYDDDFFTPNERVWDGIIDHLPQKKRKGFGILIFTSLLLFISTIYFYNKSQDLIKNSSFEQSIEKDINILSTLKTDQYFEKNKILKHSMTQNTKHSLSNLAQPVTNSIHKNVHYLQTGLHSSIYKSNDSVGIQQLLVGQPSEDLNVLIKRNNFPSNNGFNNQNSQSSVLEKFKSLNTVSSLKLKELIKPDEDQFIDLLNEKPKVLVENFTLKGFVSKEFFITQPTISINNPLSELASESFLQNDFITGLSVLKKKSKNVFELGMEYGRYTYNVHYDINLPYDLSVEENHGDISTNHLNHNLPNAISNIATDLVLQRSTSSPIQHNENVYLTLDSKLKYDVYRLNVSYQRKFGNFYAGISVLPGIKANISETNNLLSHHSYVKTRAFQSEVKLLNRFSMDLALQGSYLININDDTCLGLSASIRTDALNTNHPIRFRPALDFIKKF